MLFSTTQPPFGQSRTAEHDAQFVTYLNLKLREIGQPGVPTATGADSLAPLVDHFLALSREKDRALSRLREIGRAHV